jgi:hypothetical protein
MSTARTNNKNLGAQLRNQLIGRDAPMPDRHARVSTLTRREHGLLHQIAGGKNRLSEYDEKDRPVIDAMIDKNILHDAGRGRVEVRRTWLRAARNSGIVTALVAAIGFTLCYLLMGADDCFLTRDLVAHSHHQ